jgi:flagellar basal-body rod protein FlgB
MNRIFLEDNLMGQMEHYLDMSSKRQTIIASNLSNVDTPGYKTLDVDFESELRGAMDRTTMAMEVTNGRHIPAGVDTAGQQTGAPKEVEGLTLRNDLNNVNIDREMARMSTNSMLFSAIALVINSKFRSLRTALTP